MSVEGESSPNHAIVPTNAPGTASAVDMARNKHILNISLNNNDQTMGQMAGLIAKASGRKRSADPPSDTKRSRENTQSDEDLSLHAQDNPDDEDLRLLTEQSSATVQARETSVPKAKILQDIANGFCAHRRQNHAATGRHSYKTLGEETLFSQVDKLAR